MQLSFRLNWLNYIPSCTSCLLYLREEDRIILSWNPPFLPDRRGTEIKLASRCECLNFSPVTPLF